MNEYGVFANLVATAGCLSAAAAAIGLAWLRRAKWQPPEETLPAATARFSSLIAMVFIAIIFVFGRRWGVEVLAVLSVAFLLISLYALLVTTRTNITYSFYYPPTGNEADRTLGGSELTPEARKIQKHKGLQPQQLLQDAQGDKDLVWTRESRAEVGTRSTLSYIALIGCGSCTVAAASMLVAVSVGS